MNRRKAREIALQALFQLDFNNERDTSAEERALAAAMKEEGFDEIPDDSYAVKLLKGTDAHINEIDSLIAAASKEWKLERMAAVDRNIVRMAIYEYKFAEEELSKSIVINEAVELAKKFGTDKSGGFINGVLETVFE